MQVYGVQFSSNPFLKRGPASTINVLYLLAILQN